MKKTLLFLTTLAIFSIGGCSTDEEKNTCESCTGANISYELCDNGNGTYTWSKGDVSQTLTQADLIGLSIKEYVNILCSEEN
jgi:hypothetical protein